MTSRALKEAFAQCARRTRRAAKNFYLAFRPLPEPKRQAIFALYAFAREADDLVDDESRAVPERAERLEAYRRAWAVACGGASAQDSPEGLPEGLPAAYAWLLAVAETRQRYALNDRYFEALLDGCAQDLTQTRYATRDDTLAYCFQVASAVGLLCLPIFGINGDPAAATEAGTRLGYGMQMTNILRDLREDARRDRIYLPLEALKRFGVTEAELLAGRESAALAALIRDEAARAGRDLAAWQTLAPLLETDACYCPAALGRVYGAILARIEDDPLVVLRRRVSLPVTQKLAIALGTYWRCRWARRRGCQRTAPTQEPPTKAAAKAAAEPARPIR